MVYGVNRQTAPLEAAVSRRVVWVLSVGREGGEEGGVQRKVPVEAVVTPRHLTKLGGTARLPPSASTSTTGTSWRWGTVRSSSRRACTRAELYSFGR